MTRIFEESKEKKKIIGIRTDDDDFWCGYVEDYSETTVTIRHFTRNGMPDGLIIEKLENIDTIEQDDHYFRSMQYLVQNAHLLLQTPPPVLETIGTDNWKYDTLLQIQAQGNVVAIDLSNDVLISGFVSALDTDFVDIKTLGEMGQDTGHALYRLEDIRAIQYGRMESEIFPLESSAYNKLSWNAHNYSR